MIAAAFRVIFLLIMGFFVFKKLHEKWEEAKLESVGENVDKKLREIEMLSKQSDRVAEVSVDDVNKNKSRLEDISKL